MATIDLMRQTLMQVDASNAWQHAVDAALAEARELYTEEQTVERWRFAKSASVRRFVQMMGIAQ